MATLAELVAGDTGERDPHAEARAEAVRLLGEQAAAAILWRRDEQLREEVGELVADDARVTLLYDAPEPGSVHLLVQMPGVVCSDECDSQLWGVVETGGDLLTVAAGRVDLDQTVCRECGW